VRNPHSAHFAIVRLQFDVRSQEAYHAGFASDGSPSRERRKAALSGGLFNFIGSADYANSSSNDHSVFVTPAAIAGVIPISL
jgi:hypothetical protein